MMCIYTAWRRESWFQAFSEAWDGGENSPSAVAEPLSQDSALEEVPYEVGIVRRFPFSSSLQRMSVVCRTLGRRYMDLYVKGAPETIQPLCDPATVPENYYEVLQGYALQGFRVLALACRPLEKKLTWHHVQRISRDHVECNLSFLGFLVMQNMLKAESTPVIGMLHNASIRCVMVTGDNLLTAVSVARDCNMIASTVRVVVVRASIDHGNSTARVEFEQACHADEFASTENKEGFKARAPYFAPSMEHLRVLGAAFKMKIRGAENNIMKLQIVEKLSDYTKSCRCIWKQLRKYCTI